MHDGIEIMQIAVRVLTAVSRRRAADSKDIAELEAFAGPKPEGMDLDEFTCAVIQQALRKRATSRGAL
jgi:hypothetical protein